MIDVKKGDTLYAVELRGDWDHRHTFVVIPLQVTAVTDFRIYVTSERPGSKGQDWFDRDQPGVHTSKADAVAGALRLAARELVLLEQAAQSLRDNIEALKR